MTQTMISNYLAGTAKTSGLYRKPNDETLLFQPLERALGDSRDSATITIQDFFGDSREAYCASSQQCVSTQELIRLLEAWIKAPRAAGLASDINDGSTINRSDFSEASFENFSESYRAIQKRVDSGEIQKAVPVVFAQTSKVPTAVDKFSWLLALLRMPPHLHVFAFWDHDRGFMGATPEILFHQKNDVLHTMALAGTRPKAKEHASEGHKRKALLHDEKEMFEHRLVVQDISERLGDLGELQISKTEELELPTLFHLHTAIQLSGVKLEATEWIHRLHPTPALGVAPRSAGIDWLKELPEQKQRGHFGAPVVFKLSDKEQIALVNIRSIEWDNSGTRIGTGCGIVKDSAVDQEWQELKHKRQAIFKSLGLL